MNNSSNSILFVIPGQIPLNPNSVRHEICVGAKSTFVAIDANFLWLLIPIFCVH